MPTYTTEEKEQLLHRFTIQANERKIALETELTNLNILFTNKIQRKINKIPKKFMDLKIKDVLMVEREHKLQLYTLIRDIKQIQQQDLMNDGLKQGDILKIKQQLQKRQSSFNGKVKKPKNLKRK